MSNSIPNCITTVNTNSVTISTANLNYASPILTSNIAPSGLSVTGDSEFHGDIKIKGRSLEKLLESIEDRLLILRPDPKKLEKYAALKKAYDHYKLLERLINED